MEKFIERESWYLITNNRDKKEYEKWKAFIHYSDKINKEAYVCVVVVALSLELACFYVLTFLGVKSRFSCF